MRLPAALALPALLLIAPLANAQIPSAPAPVLGFEGIDAPSGPLVPGGDAQPVTIEWRYSTQSPAQSAAPTAGTTIHWGWQCPPLGLRLDGPRTTPIAFQPGANSYTGRTRFNLSAAAHTPGMQLLACEVTGKADAAGPALPESNEVHGMFQAFAAFVGKFRLVVADDGGGEGAPGQPIPLHVRVDSLANAQAVVTLTATALPDGWTVEEGAPIVLNAGSSADATVLVAAPRGALWADRQQDLVLVAASHSAVDQGLQGEPASAPATARLHGVDAGSPAAGILLALLAGGAAAGVIAWQRRRADEREGHRWLRSTGPLSNSHRGTPNSGRGTDRTD